MKSNKFYLIRFFLIAVVIRFGVSFISDPFVGGVDSREYYHNSINFEVLPEAGERFQYTKWYERTPVYVVFLHLIRRELIIQILLSAFACLLMYRMNMLAGYLWLLFPEDILLSSAYLKESLLIFFIIAALYLFRDKPKILFIIPVMAVAAFASHGLGVVDYNISKTGWTGIVNLWHPYFMATNQNMGPAAYILAVPYLYLMIYFITMIYAQKDYYKIIWLIFYTALFAVPNSPKYKFYLLPFIIYWVAVDLENQPNYSEYELYQWSEH